MSWAGDDWTVGLTGHVLQKVQQLQALNEKLNKEKQQRQLQLDNSEAALHKQKQRYEEVRVELAAVQRELGGVREAVQVEVRARERLSHDLQVKTGQVHSLEGQLESARKQTQNLTQEIKRLEAELEKLQKGNGSGESMLFSTPCWNMSSPWDNNAGGFRAESESKTQHARQQLQFGDVPKPSVGGASSPFPQQPHKTPPLRRNIRQSEPSTPSSVFPWERVDLWSTPKGRPASSVSSSDVIIKNSDSGMEEALRNGIDELRVRVTDLQREAQLESERLRDMESRLAQANREISTKEQSLTRMQDQLTRAQTHITQETDRAQASEQKVKHLQEELKCQRQNAESSRCSAEQRRKDMEREHQRELLELQRERQAQERQHQQETNRLNQEIQLARTLHNTLQAQHDKVCLQKQSLERDLEDVRGKLKNTESDLKESQKRESQTEAKLTEALRDCESLTVSLGQMKKQEKALQEEVKRLTEELAEALRIIKELQAQLVAPPPAVAVPHFSSAGDCFSPSVSLHRDHSPPYSNSSQRKKAPKAGQTREERMKYPSGREPGEGIDSEHIGKFESEESQKFKGRGIQTHPIDPLRLSETDVETSVTEQDTGIEDVDTDSESTSGTMPKSESAISCSLQIDDTSGKTEKRDSAPIKDLKKENAELRDELRDVKYELQKRLEDLETQRRAETEARTKLKQLSRKHSTQTEQQHAKALELKDSVTKLEAQLEQEKKESTKLRETLDSLEREAEKKLEEIERDQEEGTQLKNDLAEMEKKETCMEEEMTRMKKDLQDLQLKLAQEREEREREREEERKRIRKEELEGLKIAQLQEELDSLRKSRSLEEKISKDNLPLTYLQLEHHPNTDNNPAVIENKDFVPSPDSQEFICDSVNLQNTMVCKETRTVELIMDFGAQTKPTDDKTSAAEMGRTQALSKDASDLDSTTVLVLELERMRAARDRESEKAKLAQGKLEVLQKQVTTQTKNLTQAFESQSKHIENLLKELHDKDFSLKKQSKELQKCQEKIALLEEEEKHTSMTIVPKEVSTPPELSTEISRELSCDSVFSNTSISDLEMFSDDTQPVLKEKVSQPSVQLPASQNFDQTNTSKISDKLQATEASKPHEHCGNAQDSSADSEAPRLSELTDENTSSLLQNEQLDVLNFQNHVPEPSTGDIKELERVTEELQDAPLELNVLKAQNSELALQGDMIKEELLTVKQENEELKLKLKHLAEDTCAKQDGALLLVDTENEELSSTKEGLQSGSPLGQEELIVLHADSKAEVQSLQEEIQALQEQIQHLSEQNRTQAEELELWKLSEETVGNSSPSIVLKEFELYLPCSPRKLHTQSQITRTMMHQCTVQDVSNRSGLANTNDQINLGKHVSPKTQMTHNVRESQEPDKTYSFNCFQDLMTGNENVLTKEHAQHKCESSSVNNKSPPVCVSNIMSSNTKDKPSPPLTKPADYSNSDSPTVASLSPEDQTKAEGASAHSQDDALISVSISTKYQVINLNPIPESCGTADSQNAGVLCPEHNDIETMETVDSDKHGHCHGETTDKPNKHAEKPVKNESAPCKIVEVIKVRTEVKSVSTQTEESQDLILGDKQPPIHTCTQTDVEQLEMVEDKGDKQPADSPPISPTPQPLTNQLLLSSTFPMNNPAHLAERIRQNRSRMSAAYDETEYEPYGLPEVVMKGFADIPSGAACPYVLRRGLLGTDAVPLPRREAAPQEDDDDDDIEP
ncbi:centromere protein F isoform X1 [Carassius carassius]|uniref:centromere protein F isoform X1 n=1 Tax=Carassius carassius TaxID=217509 RepID=UPI002869356B|nr:centromere protein F isoform X1 [Carassius carassius]XP_059372175.1 centromere protein F isoform X1 [Carassius carassius]XP_059372176.1 centromere protein F isoform X1 [Carassius carassius]XP_059372177.1 centromere protein F isoform X1 [Carassius carassius]